MKLWLPHATPHPGAPNERAQKCAPDAAAPTPTPWPPSSSCAANGAPVRRSRVAPVWCYAGSVLEGSVHSKLSQGIVRCEREKPGELIHIDIKKLGRIDGVGHRITGDRTGQSNKRGIEWEYLHVAIDDACRLAYTEVLVNEKAESAVAFTRRSLAWFKRFGVSVERIMTDTGRPPLLRNPLWRQVLAL